MDQDKVQAKHAYQKPRTYHDLTGFRDVVGSMREGKCLTALCTRVFMIWRYNLYDTCIFDTFGPVFIFDVLVVIGVAVESGQSAERVMVLCGHQDSHL